MLKCGSVGGQLAAVEELTSAGYTSQQQPAVQRVQLGQQQRLTVQCGDKVEQQKQEGAKQQQQVEVHAAVPAEVRRRCATLSQVPVHINLR